MSKMVHITFKDERIELWVMKDEGIGIGIDGIAPVGADVQNYPSASNAEGRYGLVGKVEKVSERGEIRYGPVEELARTNSGGTARVIKTPRRRLVSENVFDRMMLNSNQSPRNRSRSGSYRPRGGKTPSVPNNQKLISTFITPQRGNGV